MCPPPPLSRAVTRAEAVMAGVPLEGSVVPLSAIRPFKFAMPKLNCSRAPFAIFVVVCLFSVVQARGGILARKALSELEKRQGCCKKNDANYRTRGEVCFTGAQSPPGLVTPSQCYEIGGIFHRYRGVYNDGRYVGGCAVSGYKISIFSLLSPSNGLCSKKTAGPNSEWTPDV